MTRKRFQIRGMHCAGCAMLIEGVLEDMQGVKSANTSYVRQIVDVEYDEVKVSEEAILRAVQEAGYSAVAALSDTHS